MTEPVAGTRRPVADASLERGKPAASARSRPGRTPNPSAARGPRVVFVIVNWRSAADTIRCLESFAQLDWPNPEFLVVENDSRDGSATKLIEATADRPDVQMLYPVHPNPNVRDVAHRVLRGHPSIQLVDPLDYPAMVAAMRACTLILTDSGGVQEEAPSLGKPVLVLRTTTERPEGVTAGSARLVGTDRATIVAEASRLLDDPKAYAAMATVKNPYGDGRASLRIVERCRAFFSE